MFVGVTVLVFTFLPFFLLPGLFSLLVVNRPRPQAFDQHMNMVLGDVTETITSIETDEETFEQIVRSVSRDLDMLFVRGDGVILVAPPLRTA